MRLERGILEETRNGEGEALALAWGASRAAALRAELDRTIDLAAAPKDAIGIFARRENVEIFEIPKSKIHLFCFCFGVFHFGLKPLGACEVEKRVESD